MLWSWHNLSKSLLRKCIFSFCSFTADHLDTNDEPLSCPSRLFDVIIIFSIMRTKETTIGIRKNNAVTLIKGLWPSQPAAVLFKKVVEFANAPICFAQRNANLLQSNVIRYFYVGWKSGYWNGHWWNASCVHSHRSNGERQLKCQWRAWPFYDSANWE